MNLRFYLFVSGVDQGNEGEEEERGDESKISLSYPVFRELSLSLIASEMV